MKTPTTLQNWMVVSVIEMRFNIDLDSGDGFDDAIQGIKELIDHINDRMQMVAERLADIGITTAQASVGDEYEPYILFSKQVTDSKEGECTVCMYADNVGQMISRWETKAGPKSAEVNAVLMNEVGSGWRANNPDGLKDAGQGTFPGQKHAFDPRGWYWVDSTGKHHSFGEVGNLSMHKAFIAMQQEIGRVISEVFG